MRIINRLTAVSFIALCTLTNVQAVNYYVAPAPTGSDGAAGTQAAPFATIAKARDVVKALGSLSEDVNVYLRDGWYFQTTTLAFDQTNSGTNNHVIVYQAYPNEHPVISGGKKVTGWTLHDASKNIWKATAPAGATNRQLWVNCIRAVRAHRGAGLWGGATKATDGLNIGGADGVMATWKNPSDIELLWTGEGYTVSWSEKRGVVQSISTSLITMKQPCWNNLNRSSQYESIRSPSPSDIENAYELLDQPGEWYLDKSANTFYYIPLFGQNMATAQVFTPVVEKIVSLVGTLDSPVQNIQFKGITFAHGTYLLPNTDGFPEWQTCNLTGTSAATLGNVSASAAQNLRFERCFFTHLGGAGIDLGHGAKNNVVIGCVFTDISGNMVQVGYFTDPTRSDTRVRDSGNQIVNCYLHDGPCEYHGGGAIVCGYVSDMLISHNYVAYNPNGQICIGWGWSGTTRYPQNNKITYNKLHDNNFYLTMGDVGPVYTLSAQPNSSIRGNYCNRGAGPGMWYLDQGTAFFVVDSNVNQNNAIDEIWGTPFYWTFMNYGAHDNQWRNNYTDYANPGLSDIYGSAGVAAVLVQNNQWPAAAQAIMNNSGLQSAYSDIVTMVAGCERNNQVEPPVVLSASLITANQLELIFNKPMSNASVENIANYSVSNGLTISKASLDLHDMSYTHVVLTFSSNPAINVPYTLTINNAKDRLSKPATIAANTQVPFGVPNLGNGLVGWWKLDETSGSTAADASGNGYNGTITGTTSWAAGKVNNGITFTNLTSGNIAVPSGALGQITGDCTAMAWVKITNDAWSKVFSGSLGLSLWRNNTQWQFWTKSGNFHATPEWNVPAPGFWQHVVIQRKGNEFLLYQDGKKMFDAPGILDSSKSATVLNFGGNSFVGMIDDVRLYKRALSEQEIKLIVSGYAGTGSTDIVARNIYPVIKKSGMQNIAVYNMKGALIKEWKTFNGTYDGPAIVVPKGIYVVHSTGASGVTIRKMVIMNNATHLDSFIF